MALSVAIREAVDVEVILHLYEEEGEKYWDLVEGVRAGYSIINFDLKLAYWMGIREIYVIGVDFSLAEIAAYFTAKSSSLFRDIGSLRHRYLSDSHEN